MYTVGTIQTASYHINYTAKHSLLSSTENQPHCSFSTNSFWAKDYFGVMSPSQVPWPTGVSWGTWLHVTLSHLSHYTRFVSPFLGGLKTTEVKNKLAFHVRPAQQVDTTQCIWIGSKWFRSKISLVPVDYWGMSWMVYQVVVFLGLKTELQNVKFCRKHWN